VRIVWWTAIFVIATVAGALLVPSRHAAIIVSTLLAASALVSALVFRSSSDPRHRGSGAVASSLPASLLVLGIGTYVGARSAGEPALAPQLASALDDERGHVVEGIVMTPPEGPGGTAGSGAGTAARMRIAVDHLDEVRVDGAVVVSIHEDVPALLPGDAVRLTAALHSVRGLANPGVPDASLQARAAGIDAYAAVRSAAAIERLDAGARGASRGSTAHALIWCLRLAARAHGALHAAIAGHAGAAGTGSRDATRFLFTAVLGERSQVDAAIEEGFRAAGATHVLSVSGLHLAAIAVVFFAGARRALGAVPGLPLWIDPRRIAAMLAVPAVAFYTLVSGNAVATVRSALMMAVGLVGLAVGRRASTLVTIALAVLALMAWSPLVLFDVSFQLSVVSVLALAVTASRLAPPPPRRGAGRVLRLRSALGRLGAATLAAGAATAPLVAHHFGEVTPAAPLGNLLLVPLVEMVVVPFGLAGAAAGALGADRIGAGVLAVATVAARLALTVAEGFRAAAPVWLTRAPNMVETTAWVAGAVLALAALPRATPDRGAKLVAAGALLAIGLASATARDLARRFRKDLVVTFLDVGQGDAAVIEAPGGTTILIDGGGSIDGAFDPGARVVEPFLRARGITSAELVILSHPHPDHMGGLPRILQRFPVAALWSSGDDGHDPRYDALVALATRRGAARPVPARLDVASLTLEPLGPFVADGHGGEQIGPPEGTTVNDASLVVRATFGQRALLFSGDVEANGEGELVGRRVLGQNLAADVLKVPHHGSRTSSSADLLEAVAPHLAVMSLGWRNRFHFPNPDVLARYRSRGIRVLRTDRDGAVSLRIAPDGTLGVTCERGCP
jgi:competence protein ComEC